MPKKSILEKPDQPDPTDQPDDVEDQPQPTQPTQPTKPKQRTQKQIDTTNKMRDALKLKRSEDVILKEKAKLEHDELRKHIKKKLFAERVKEKVQSKINEITESNYSSDEDNNNEVQISPVHVNNQVVIKKQLPTPVKQPISAPVTINRQKTITFY